MTPRARGVLGLLVLAVASVASVASAIVSVKAIRGTTATIFIGSKTFSESWILAEIYAQRIERATGMTVGRRHALAGTMLLFEGLASGTLDLYPEYTGTALTSILNEPVPDDAAAVLPRVRQEFERRWGMRWLEPQAFNNSYSIAMQRSAAEALGVTTVSQLDGHPELSAGFATEFVARDDGWPGLSLHYGLALDARPHAMEAGLMYQAAGSGEVDLISAYTTDARVDKFDLKVLEDDKAFFPPYQAAPLLARGVAERYPEIVAALAPLAGRLTDEQMRRLNAEVDIDKRDPKAVASDYLDSIGL